MIVNYSPEYLGDVTQLIKNFCDEAVCEYDNGIDHDTIIETIKTTDPENIYLLIIDGVAQGILSGIRFKSPTSGKMIFQEMIWYVNKDHRTHGIRLLRTVEKMLISCGVSVIIMAVLENSKTEKIKALYERLGFKKMETHYVRTL